jgi:hypothetical protein
MIAKCDTSNKPDDLYGKSVMVKNKIFTPSSNFDGRVYMTVFGLCILMISPFLTLWNNKKKVSAMRFPDKKSRK